MKGLRRRDYMLQYIGFVVVVVVVRHLVGVFVVGASFFVAATNEKLPTWLFASYIYICSGVVDSGLQ